MNTPKLPMNLKTTLREMIDELNDDYTKMEKMNCQANCGKLVKEKIRYFTYLHNANIPKATKSLEKMESIWQDIHYQVTFDTDDRYVCALLENTTHMDVVDEKVTFQLSGNDKVSHKDNENSVMMGKRMMDEIEEFKHIKKVVIEVLDIVKLKGINNMK